MPSPDLLPKGRSFPTATPPPLDHVVHRAVRRRRVQLGVAGAVSACASVAVVLLLTTTASPNSLKVVTPAIDTTPSVHPSVHPSVPPPVGGAPAHAPSRVGSATAPHHGAVATSGPAEPTTASSVVADHPGIIGPPHRIVQYDATRTCNGTGPTAAQGWCSYYDGATSGVAGHPVELATAVCRLPGAGSGTLVADDGRQADFDVGVDTYPASWTWSRGERFASGSTSVSVAAGTCVEWYVTWNVTDDAGRPLPPGSYYLDATPLAQASDANASAAADNPGTFTVR